jgi:sugar lactone lactonase YvrE
LILPTMLIYLAVAGDGGREAGPCSLHDGRTGVPGRDESRPYASALRRLQGAAVLTLITLALLLPRLPTLVEKQSAVEAAVAAGSILPGGPADLPKALANQGWASLRAFVLMDPSLTGNPRYLAPGWPVLDSFTAALYFVGLFLGLRRFRQTALWWCLLVPALLVSSLARAIPDGARALPTLPAMLLFAGLTIDWLIGRKNLGDLAGLGLTLAIPLAAYWNWTHYVEWQRQPSNAAARQPAVEVAEFPIWQELQLAQAQAGEAGFGPSEWQDLREQYQPALAAAAAASTGGRVASKIETQPLAGFGTVAGLKRPRGVAVDASGAIFVLDADGRVLKLEQSGKIIATLGTATGGPPSEEVSDLALAPDGSLLVLDAGPGRIDRYDAGGRFAASLGAGWGMYRPRGLAVGPDGRIYVADTGRSRVVVANARAVEKELPDLEQPTDVAVDGSGRIYVAQPEVSKLSVLDSDGKMQTSWDISRGNTVDGPHLAFLEAGALAIADPAKHRVVFSDPSGRELGQIGGENGPALGLPYAVAAAGQRLLVADSGKPGLEAYELVVR